MRFMKIQRGRLLLWVSMTHKQDFRVDVSAVKEIYEMYMPAIKGTMFNWESSF